MRCLNCDAMLVDSRHGVDRSGGSPEDSAVTQHDDFDLSREAAQGFAIEAVTQTLGGATDVDTCVNLTARGNCLADEALTYFSTARPAACSGYHSLSRQRCEDAHFNTDTFEGIPMSQAFNYVAAALQGGVDQGLARLGLSAARFELHAAVAALLRNPGTIQRWRSGRTLLKEDGSRAAAGSL